MARINGTAAGIIGTGAELKGQDGAVMDGNDTGVAFFTIVSTCQRVVSNADGESSLGGILAHANANTVTSGGAVNPEGREGGVGIDGNGRDGGQGDWKLHCSCGNAALAMSD